MTDAFEFVHGDRTFTCNVEAPRTARAEAWWWFRVSSNARAERYAPFRAGAEDTRENVEERIIAYHDELLRRRAAPAVGHHWRRGRPGAADAADGAATAAATDAEAEAPAV
jgi:hypothetical protein